MSFEIRATDIGPIILHNDNLVPLTSEDAMIELCYEDGTRFNLIQDHIKEELQSACDTYIEGFMMGINPPAGRLYAYIAAFQQFWMFKHIRFAQYLSALHEAEEE
jgi:hypothetical protein